MNCIFAASSGTPYGGSTNGNRVLHDVLAQADAGQCRSNQKKGEHEKALYVVERHGPYLAQVLLTAHLCCTSVTKLKSG